MIVLLAVFVGVSALVGSVAFLLRGNVDQKAEDRLAMFMTATTQNHGAAKAGKGSAVLTSAIGDSQ
jgi:hypothetical protein